ncbi:MULTISPECIES: sulfite exporter TauE/SafE family protein [Haloferax]|uniref:Probable membrane transporter protein n=1 Tax=Haloferax marinum TaxID=2666143 RepID=A0A6A8GAD2_9EURY|nr:MULTISPECIES: sulfite exporter TauE/SafE family protein [Haloferax]KAB1198449.1 sulfite exporter TauE/SafE family protein [Haloferax sp. CBA1150]MRW97552.1 TSUP family transporter [Haloferax marinum]
MEVTLAAAALVFGIVALGGFVTGVNGFGFSVVGTALLAATIGPQTAVVVMILPILAGNVSLVRELDRTSMQSCVRRFWPYVAGALVGTVVGMLLLSVIPTQPLTLALGVFVLVYVAFSQPWVSIPGERRLRTLCFTDGTGMKAALGLVSGLVFGASNVGVQVIAYLQSLELDRQTFVGVVAMIFLGISTVRVVMASALGLFGGGDVLLLSAVAAVPGLLGVSAGKWVRPRLPVSYQQVGTMGLLFVIGLRLTSRGIGF